MKVNNYILKDKVPIPIEDIREWARQFDDDQRLVQRDEYGDITVSTVFLGIDHSFGEGRPLLFETMIFGGEHDGYQTRCSTWDEAVEQHKIACVIVSNSIMLWIKRNLNL
jgi:hypothetical protein